MNPGHPDRATLTKAFASAQASFLATMNCCKRLPEAGWGSSIGHGRSILTGTGQILGTPSYMPFASALKSLDESDRLGAGWQSRNLNDLLRAMVLMRLGRVKEARPYLEKAANFVHEHLTPGPDAPFGDLSTGAWWDSYTFQLFRGEAEVLLRDAESALATPRSP